MGYTIGGIACLVYAAFVYYVAIGKPPSIIKIIKWKLSKNMSDKAAVILCYIFATVALAGGIVLIILGKR
ncbi:MAG: hypothetical protein U9O59_08580 [Actinomycetota bacterium]|nr:hypothetical protein [Actinomycetota bacterium]